VDNAQQCVIQVFKELIMNQSSAQTPVCS
jgi:hypothetical protein